MPQEIPKAYEPQEIEERWAKAWYDEKLFRAENSGNGPAFSIALPPPNITGTIHIGHLLEHTQIDMLVRWHRMRGDRTLWLPGMDHAGIATQFVVERMLAKEGIKRQDLGREEFERRVWKWREESGGAIKQQMIQLGASCDWTRERFTLEPALYRSVLEAFLRLYREGLIYRGRYITNWCPRCMTAISDLEVVHNERVGEIWNIRYPIVGSNEMLVVATTRPETMLGDTAVAVHPDDERYQHLIGKRVRLPLVGRLIAVVADDYSDPEKGTGAVKITPAHDFNDFEVGKRHEAEGVRPINVLDAQGRVVLKDNLDFFEGLESDHDHARLIAAVDSQDRFVARLRIVEMMALAGLLARIEPHAHAVPHGDRSNAVVEPWLTDQWYVDAKALAGPAIDAVRDGQTQFVPKSWEKTYFDWLENIQPWCVSRQLWWGHQIPAWYAPWGAVYVEETEEAAYADALADGVERGALTESEAQALASDPARLAETFTRDEDGLDTWVSSG